MKRAGLLFGLAYALAFGQLEEKSAEHKTFSGVRELIIHNVNGSIEVTTSTGAAVEIDIARTLSAETSDRLALARKEAALEITQEGGLVRLRAGEWFRNFGDPGYRATYDFKVRVPREILLDLRTVDRSNITVEGTSGEFKISSVNGGIEMRDVEGSGTAKTVNGPVKAIFARNPTGPVSFKSVNSTLDVTFRAGLNADVRMKTLNGSLFTDFATTAVPAAVESQADKGRIVFRSHRMTGVRIGSGGPELSFETVNGDVLIKNGEK
jgi:DUF4097 and DUF4098 domain-containing protein YvlB